jgi:hypothetical protein
MSAPDPLRRGTGRGAIRAVEPREPDSTDAGDRRPLDVIRCTYRPTDADFYCWKFGVWYNLMDCNYRHHGQTYEGCVDCGQGRSNLRQNLGRFRAGRAERFGPERP